MFRWIKKIVARVLILIFLIEIAPLSENKNNSFIKLEKASAFETQLDCIAPGYVIRRGPQGITFDLSKRLTDTMSVQSFKFRNADPNKRKDDKEEEMLDGDNSIWVSKDNLEHGNIYEIEADIYDSETDRTVKHINSFRFKDRTKMFKPKVQVLDMNGNIKDYLNRCAFRGIEVDLGECKELADKSKRIEVEILNSDLSKTSLDKISVTHSQLRSDSYKVRFVLRAHVIEPNKDYVLRVSFDGEIWESLISGVIRPDPKIYDFFAPNSISLDSSFRYDSNNRTFKIKTDVLKISPNMVGLKMKVILTSSSGNLKSVESETKLGGEVTINIPQEYFGRDDLANVRFICTDESEKSIFADLTTQVTLLGRDFVKLWTGMALENTAKSADGYKIMNIRVSNNDNTNNIPHSWEDFPRVHYITVYDESKTKQIGGEYRFDVINNKSEFLGDGDSGKEHDLSKCNFKIKYENMKQGFNTVYFKVESSNTNKEWSEAYVPLMFYADILKIDHLDLELSNISAGNKGYNFSINPINFKPQIGEKMTVIDDEGNEHFSSASNGKSFDFSNVPLVPGGKYIVTYKKTSSLIYFQSMDLCVLFNPVVVGTNIDGQQGIEILMKDEFVQLMNADSSRNRLRILHINGNATGNEFYNISKGSNRFKLASNLVSGTQYIAEFSNGSEVFKSTFEYTPLRLDLGSVTETTAKLEWVYPNNYLIMSGDSLNIYFKKDGFNYPAVPDAKIIHGFQEIDFDKVRTYTIKNLSPNINYTAKLELVTNEGIKFTNEVEFVTSKFQILNERIVDLSDEGIVNKKNIDVIWEINKADIEFSSEDRVDIFLKLKSHDVFPRTPEYTIKEDLNRIRKVTLDVPTYNENYSLKIVYNIGGVKHSSKILDFKVEIGEFLAEVSEIKESTAKINWEYPEESSFTDKQELRIFLKKSSDAAYPENPVFRYVHGGETNLKNILSCELTGLQEDTIYQTKIEYKIDEKIVAGVKEEIKKEYDLEFKTNKFVIDNFSVSVINNKSVKLSWNVKNKNYIYNNNDKVDVYIKERVNPNYPGNPIVSIRENLKLTDSVKFDIPKYNTDYDIKVIYILNGKQVQFYTKYKLDIGEIVSKIEDISDNSVTISWVYPENYAIQNGDRIEIKYKEDNLKDWTEHTNKIHGNGGNLNDLKSITVDNLENGKKYNLKFIFIPNGAEAIEKSYVFKAVSGFQISNIQLDSINSSSMMLSWSIYSKDYRFSSNDKIEIFVVDKEELKNQDNENIVNSKSLVTRTGNLDNFYSYKVENLSIEKEYLFRVKYTISENNADPSTEDEFYEDIYGKTEFGKFDSYVVDTSSTSVKLEVVYPENYEKVSRDTLDVFIKKYESVSYELDPNFTAVHGDEDGEFDLNEVTVLDILGLAPNTEYKAKVVFWPEGGIGSKKEKELSFKTSRIGGISEVSVLEVMDHIVKIGVKMDSEDIFFSNNDYCKVYIKKKGEGSYPSDPNGESRGDVFNNDRSVIAYFEELNIDYDVSVVVNIGGAIFEKNIDFTSKVDDLHVDVKEVNPMTVQVEWKYPDNYTLVDGESLSIYIKYKSDENFPEVPDLELIQSEKLILSDINLVELYALVPNTDYEVKVQLSLLEVDLPEVIKEFTTDIFEIEDLQIRSITDEGIAISWKINTEEIDFIDDYDNLSIFVKDVNDDEYDFSNPVAEFTKDLNEIRTASFLVDEEIENAEILVSYLIEDYESYAELKFNSVELYVEEEDGGILIGWDYPSGIEFTHGDKVQLYLKKLESSAYSKEPIFEYIHGKDGELSKFNNIYLEDIEQGSYMLKFLLMTNNVSYSPIEVGFDVGESLSNAIKLEIKDNVVGRSLILGLDYDVDAENIEEMKITPEGLKVEIIDDSEEGFLKLSDLVPDKLYKRILIKVITIDEEELDLVVENVKIEAENLLQQFLTNIYKFAFERFPDEQGYSYWLEKLLEKKEITGKYVVYNLMFAEKEFTERNLPDDELIKVLYQIVVNREYDEGGLNYWIKEYNETYLPQANNDSFEAQKAIVMRMLYEQEFRNLCEKMGILW